MDVILWPYKTNALFECLGRLGELDKLRIEQILNNLKSEYDEIKSTTELFINLEFNKTLKSYETLKEKRKDLLKKFKIIK